MVGQPDHGPVVVAEDDAQILGTLRDALRAEGFIVASCRAARSAFDAVDFHRPGVAVIDVAMEDGRGWELLYAVRSRAGTAALVLDRQGDALVRRGAIAAGAEDVVSAPFDAEEVAGRVRLLFRRQDQVARGGPVYRHGDLVVDVPAHEVRVAGRTVGLTPQQFAILRALCEAGGAALHRAQLVTRIAAIDDEPPSDRAIDLHVSRLRRRLGDDEGPARYIEAVYGIGYRLAPAGRNDVQRAQPDAVLDALPDAVLVVDDGLAVRAANRAAEILLGRPRTDLVGRSCAELLACRTCAGGPLAGPGCLGRAVLAGEGSVRHARALVDTSDGRVPVVFSHVKVPTDDGSRLVAISLRVDR